MKNKIRTVCFFVFLLDFVVTNLVFAAQLKMDLQPDGLYLNNLNVAITKLIFKDNGYESFANEEYKIPPLMFDQLPVDFDEIASKDERNKLFIMILAPLALRVNEEISIERQKLFDLREAFDSNKSLTTEQLSELDKLAEKYDVFTRMKDGDRIEILLQELAEKIDEIPPSLLIASAAAESNWGTAAEVKQGNALYKLKDWYTDKGIKPAGEDDDSYRIRVYPDLVSAVRDYALKLNNDINFQHFRIARRQLREHNQILKGRTTVYNMVIGSPLENYAGLLNYILTFYDLVNVDESKLDTIEALGVK